MFFIRRQVVKQGEMGIEIICMRGEIFFSQRRKILLRIFINNQCNDQRRQFKRFH